MLAGDASEDRKSRNDIFVRLLTWSLFAVGLKCFGYMSGANAAGADLDALYRTVPQSLDFLQVRIPGFCRLVVGVAHIVTETGPLATYCTYFSHIFISL
jgi:hypothetical protein